MSLDQCSIIDLPVIRDHRGNITYIEGSNHIPFEIARVFYLYDVPGGSERGGHAHRALQQVIVAVSGSFDVVLDDGAQRKGYHLNRSYQGLYVAPSVWRELANFSTGSVCLVLASAPFEESDYIRDYGEFIATISAP